MQSDHWYLLFEIHIGPPLNGPDLRSARQAQAGGTGDRRAPENRPYGKYGTWLRTRQRAVAEALPSAACLASDTGFKGVNIFVDARVVPQ
jgi:hypothetical protein